MPESDTTPESGVALQTADGSADAVALPGLQLDHAASADGVLAEAAGGGLTWLPYAVYLGLWVTLAVLSAMLLSGATPERPARWMDVYEPLVWAGVGLAALGPALSLTVWLFARVRRPRGARRGLFASAVTRGAVTAFFGALVWISTLYALELYASRGGS